MKIELHGTSPSAILSTATRTTTRPGVVGYGGKLDIRPPYQREFIYKDKQRDAVIDTVRKDFPLNVMYWAVRDDGTLRGDRRSTAHHLASASTSRATSRSTIATSTTCRRTSKNRSSTTGSWSTSALAPTARSSTGSRRSTSRARSSRTRNCATLSTRLMGHRRQALLQQERLPRLRHRQRLHDGDADPPGLPRDRDRVDQRRRHRGLHGHPAAQAERQRAVAVLPERHRVGEGDLPDVPRRR